MLAMVLLIKHMQFSTQWIFIYNFLITYIKIYSTSASSAALLVLSLEEQFSNCWLKLSQRWKRIVFFYFFKQMWGQRKLQFQVLILWAKKENGPTLLGNPVCPGSSDRLSCWFDIPGNWDVFYTGEIPNCLTKPKAFDLSRLTAFII